MPLRFSLLVLAALTLPAATRAQAPQHGHAHEDVFVAPPPSAYTPSQSLYRSCDPSTMSPERRCASTAIPGNLPTLQAPQFFLLSVDDCLKPETEAAMRTLLDGTLRNPDGRPIPMTYFLSLELCQTGGTSSRELVRERYFAGDEIAVHTTTHTTYDTTSAATWRRELQGVRDYLRAAGLGNDAGLGFRAPRVGTNPAMFEVLREMGFLYDSSIYESPHWSQVTQGIDRFVWPYTFDQWGPRFEDRAQQCEHFITFNKCATGPLPGLWEVPLYQYVNSNDPRNFTHLGAFDVGNPVYNPGAPALPRDSLIGLLDFHFNARYNGNRAPMNFYFHPPTLLDANLRHGYRVILEAALSRDDVWVVTMQGLIEWMKAPVPASEMKAWYASYCQRHPCSAPTAGTATDDPAAETRSDVRVYPNPSTGLATVSVTTEAPRARVAVRDMLGRMILEQELPGTGLQQMSLDLQNAAPGVYVVTVRDGARTHTQTLVRR